MRIKNLNSKLELALKIVGVIIGILILVLIVVLLTTNNEAEVEKVEEIVEEQEEKEEKTTILDIPAMDHEDAFGILDILIAEYGEPNPQGLIDVLREQEYNNDEDEEEEEIPPTFQTVTWRNIKYGYDLVINFWTDGSLARKDSYYFTGHKREGHTIEEILELTNLQKDSPDFLFNIVDFGGAVFNIGITPAKIARTPESITQEEIDELTKEEILLILEENSQKEHPNNPAKARLEYENQVEAYDWVLNVQEYPEILEKARLEWGHNYIMVKWQYEKDVKAYMSTI